MGRPTKPTLVKLAEGDAHKVGINKLREIAAREAKPIRGFPERPAHLDGEECEAWDFLTEQLAAMQLDFMPDAYALEMACVAYGVYRRAHQALKDSEGLSNTAGRNGFAMPRPEVAIAANARKEFREFCVHFGLSPMARTKLGATSQDSELAKIEEALSKPRSRTA